MTLYYCFVVLQINLQYILSSLLVNSLHATTTSKAIANSIDEANGAEEILNLFYENNGMLYNSVPTNAHKIDNLHNTVSNDAIHTNVSIMPAIIKHCLKLKPGKSDGDRGFKPDHLMHITQHFHVIIGLLFNNMLVHGYTPEYFLMSSIILIPKDNTASLTSSYNYRGISLYNSS